MRKEKWISAGGSVLCRYWVFGIVLWWCGAVTAEPGGLLLRETEFTVFDVETTGFSPETDRIVEIGAIRFRGAEVLAEAAWLVNPGRSIPEAAVRKHGITDEMVQDAPALAAVLPLFFELAGESRLLAHNASYDVRFIRSGAVRCGVVLPPNSCHDTLMFFRRMFPEQKSHALGRLIEALEVPVETRHRGLADARAVMWILQRVMAEHPEMTLAEFQEKAGRVYCFAE